MKANLFVHRCKHILKDTVLGDAFVTQNKAKKNHFLHNQYLIML